MAYTVRLNRCLSPSSSSSFATTGRTTSTTTTTTTTTTITDKEDKEGSSVDYADPDPPPPRSFSWAYLSYLFLREVRGEGSRNGRRSNYIRTTKYTVWTFLPVNLASQFRRFYNLYFLFAAVVSVALPAASPVSPRLMLTPLVFVLVVAAIKDLFEDYKRYRSDQAANGGSQTVMRHQQAFQTMKTKDILPGDIVKVSKNEEFPADMLLLASSNSDGTCFIQTAQLDGETSLKKRNAITELPPTEENFQFRSGVIECEQPNEYLYRYKGRIRFLQSDQPDEATEQSLTVDNLLLRGCILKNSSYVYGAVIYVGAETKVMQNLIQKPLKRSTLEWRLNLIVLFIFIINMIIWLISCVLSGLWQDQTGVDSWYIDWDLGGVEVAIFHLVTYFILWTYLIPISLFVTIEICRFVQMFFLQWDECMKSDISPMIASNSNLNEDLGRVDFIFSDKTGTLTKNKMSIRAWSIGGEIYHEEIEEAERNGVLMKAIDTLQLSSGSSGNAAQSKRQLDNIRHMIYAVGVCHTCVPSLAPSSGEEEDSASTILREVEYEGDSPDELSLVEGLRKQSVCFLRSNDEISLRGLAKTFSFASAKGDQHDKMDFQILRVFPFSDRKRMSVIVKRPDGVIELVCKGADDVVLARCGRPESNETSLPSIQHDIDEFATKGYRTLVVACRTLSEEDFQLVNKQLTQAELLIDDRDKAIAKVYEEFERDFCPLGVTAVEDELQDQVPESIANLLSAGITFWLLTGDKRQTAVSVAIACNLIQDKTRALILEASDASHAQELIQEFLSKAARSAASYYTMVVDGASLIHCLGTSCRESFLSLATQCRSVVCCRVSPIQKAEVVTAIKESFPGKICLSIGDGANDVSMIQTAHIGIGIIGKEGSQAKRAADYSFVEFKSLQRLLFVHGRHNYLRLADLIFFSFYKNFAMIMVIFWFGFYSGWSGQSIYEEQILAFYNVVFVSLPPFFLGIFEKDVGEEIAEKFPKLYISVRNNLYWNLKTIAGWTLAGLWHSLAVYFGLYFILNDAYVRVNGETVDFRTMAFYYSSAILLVVLLMMAFHLRWWIWLSHVGLWLSYLVYWLSFWVIAEIIWFYYDVERILLSDPLFYLSLVFVVVLSFLPVYVVRYSARTFAPTDWQILQEFFRGRPVSSYTSSKDHDAEDAEDGHASDERSRLLRFHAADPYQSEAPSAAAVSKDKLDPDGPSTNRHNYYGGLG